MIMSAADQTRYPRATRYIRNKLPRVIRIPVIRRAMQTTGQLNRRQFRTALMWGAQPTIRLELSQG
ncbi:hypothetical protein PN36_06615 [Candidatus Thiomargarita nelsonii]|uniref:Uncharacterized protein n=1 Tax=Candidatus Thiomargarita nelsonii TaxID=1003181 RepID=A0A4E0QVJ5_9GAMM|nr:hypothetical protein PN36_06615 [Candidatus Thiomargarita nelsonii]